MELSDFMGLGGLVIAAISLITGFILQKDNRKIKDLEYLNKKMQNALNHSLDALEGYEKIETQIANDEGITLKDYRTKAREKYHVKEHRFLVPSDIKEYRNIKL